MKCPYCTKTDNRVIDSRLSKDGLSIRRRRECLLCSRRFTTYETIEEVPLVIIKKDGRREVFNRDKVGAGIKRACEKRNISINVIEDFIDELERDLKEMGEKEIASRIVGEKIMAQLHSLDDVAYVRFASVYREFKDVNDFIDELNAELPPLKHFIMPGGHQTVALCHVVRTVCRRAERCVTKLAENEDIDVLVLQYLNRLSDLLFIMSRKLAQDLCISETKWQGF